MVHLEELISQLRELLEEEHEHSLLLDKLDRYSNEFELWYADHKEQVQNGLVAGAETLLEMHEQLVLRSQVWLKDASAKLAQHKIRGKGIRAYTDSLPKRISIRRSKKG